MSNQDTWDIYFIKIAKQVSENSKCLSRKIGSVLVKDKAIISTGYNGAPRGVKHCEDRTTDFYEELDRMSPKKEYCDGHCYDISSSMNCSGCGKLKKHPAMKNGEKICPRRYLGYGSAEGLHLCSAGHAERNSLIQAARNGICTKGSTLYCNCPLPCKECMIEIINAGVERIVCYMGPDYDEYSRILLCETDIRLTQIDKSLC